jgi:PAS domain S-box-containing protein
MAKKAEIAHAVVDTSTSDDAQERLASIEDALAELAREGVDAVVTRRVSVLTGAARSAVTHSEARYRHLINRMAALVAELTPLGEVVYLNEVVASITGFSVEDLTGSNWFDLVLPLQGQGVEQSSLDILRQRFLGRGELSGFRTCIRTRDLRRKIISWNSAHVMDDDGHVGGICLFGTDVTEQVVAEDELRIAAVAFESQNGMVITDPNGVILRVNSAFTRLTGYSTAEAIGRTPALLQSGRHDKLFYQRMWDALRKKGGWQGEIWNKRKNGQIYAEMLSITTIVTPDRGITNYVANFSDITENKEAEAEIHRLAYYDDLTKLPNRRLLQDRLSQAVAATSRSGRYGAIFSSTLTISRHSTIRVGMTPATCF